MATFGFDNIANIHPVSTLIITEPIILTIHPHYETSSVQTPFKTTKHENDFFVNKIE